LALESRVEAVSQTIGYARVSAADQNPALQLDALEAAGCDRVFVEKASGALRVRPQLAAALEYARAGDVFTVYKLDRLGRKVVVLADLMDHLKKREIGFRSLLDGIDTTTAMGRAFFHIQAVFAELERDLIRERAAAGRAAARARGETGGRPRAVTPEKLAAARALLETKRTVAQAAAAIGVGRSTLYRYLTVPELGQDACGGTEVSDTGFEMPEWLPPVGQPTRSRK
jgi:DNA invertase Pin-like site-specific DNA recombinase